MTDEDIIKEFLKDIGESALSNLYSLLSKDDYKETVKIFAEAIKDYKDGDN